jgi:hypothetical protein
MMMGLMVSMLEIIRALMEKICGRRLSRTREQPKRIRTQVRSRIWECMNWIKTARAPNHVNLRKANSKASESSLQLTRPPHKKYSLPQDLNSETSNENQGKLQTPLKGKMAPQPSSKHPTQNVRKGSDVEKDKKTHPTIKSRGENKQSSRDTQLPSNSISHSNGSKSLSPQQHRLRTNLRGQNGGNRPELEVIKEQMVKPGVNKLKDIKSRGADGVVKRVQKLDQMPKKVRGISAESGVRTSQAQKEEKQISPHNIQKQPKPKREAPAHNKDATTPTNPARQQRQTLEEPISIDTRQSPAAADGAIEAAAARVDSSQRLR